VNCILDCSVESIPKKFLKNPGHRLAMSTSMKSLSSAATERILSIRNHLKDSSNPAVDIQQMKMSVPYKFRGWMGLDKNSSKGKLVWQEYEPKTWTEDDVDIKITHCGICASDLHTLRSGWVIISI
jgi:alcohol dehydrogenase (NADP+)